MRWGIYAVELRRRRQRPWLWRTVNLPSGRFFVLNQVICGTTTVFWTGATFAAYYALCYRDFAAPSASRHNLGVIGATLYIPLSLNGWLMGWSIVQAHLIVMESKVGWAAGAARWAAVAFWATSVLVVPLVVVIPLVAARRWDTVYHHFEATRVLMMEAIAVGTTTDAGVIGAIDEQANLVRRLVDSHDAAQRGINIMYAVLALGKAIVSETAGLFMLSVRDRC